MQLRARNVSKVCLPAYLSSLGRDVSRLRSLDVELAPIPFLGRTVYPLEDELTDRQALLQRGSRKLSPGTQRRLAPVSASWGNSISTAFDAGSTCTISTGR